jgi:BirA family biotin operon repressor/biotin-[acetyl-CoA-carboxylase] ligase
VAGILSHAVDGDVVIGIGINVSQTADELPASTATSPALAGASAPDRTALLVALLCDIDAVVGRWAEDNGDLDVSAPGAGGLSLADKYAQVSATLGTPVRVELAGGTAVIEGTAQRIAADGSLVVAREDGSVRIVAAGDVHHLRAR